MALDLKRLLGTFLEEAAEHVATLEDGLLRLESGPVDQDLVDSVFRAAHSLKGGSATLGLGSIASLTHALETVLDGIRRGDLASTTQRVEVLLRATDALRSLLGAAASDDDPGLDVAPLVAALEGVSGKESPPAGAVGAVEEPEDATPAAEREVEVVFVPQPEFFLKGMDPLLLLRDLAAAGQQVQVTAHLDELPALDRLDPERCYLGWTVRLTTAVSMSGLRDLFMFVEDDCRLEIRELAAVEATTPAAFEDAADPQASRPAVSEPANGGARGGKNPAGTVPVATSIRVATDKLDRLVDLVGELVIVQSMLNQTVSDFSMDRLVQLQEAVAEMERNTRELQERVMSIRTLPVSTVCSRFPRMVRDLGAALNKSVAFQVAGGDTELDKSVIERLGDPLVHLVRNAVDHGIEDRAGRLAAGKPEQGTIRLSAAHRGGKVVIEIRDDGKGLDKDRILAKARVLGIVDHEQELPDEQIWSLIFHPGFSTVERVSDLSGRGVGMDVVKQTIDALNGTVAIETERGRGTCFRITLPLTLAILDGLCVRVREQIYVIPLIAIVESLRLRATDVRVMAGRKEVMAVRGQALPLLRLDRRFQVHAGARLEEAPSPWALVVIVESEGTRVALLVDDILGQSQVVIKSLEANFRRVEGLMGATILGDGRVALILDVHALARRDQPGAGGPAKRMESDERQVSA